MSQSTSNEPEYFDLTPDWYEMYVAMLDIVYPSREETIIYNLNEKGDSR
jgi:hypothetical protein